MELDIRFGPFEKLYVYTFDSDTVCSTRVSEKKVTAINMPNFDSIIFTK